MRSKKSVSSVIWQTVKEQKWLSCGILIAVIGAIVTSVVH